MRYSASENFEIIELVEQSSLSIRRTLAPIGVPRSTFFAGIPIGLCLTLIHLFLIPVTNASVNPARSTGPALFAGGAYITQLWLFWLAPILGAAIAGVVSR